PRKTRRTKTFKQLMADEQKLERSRFLEVAAGPSTRPQEKWCDITGLPGRYRAPSSGLRYYNKEVYQAIRYLGPGVDQEYLALRSAHAVLR
ncbi:hypothetical protein CANCADRAFT_18096, partial [Tortispora caseinolytica NRRL Y-17796]